jgi:hypothetical protein
VGCGFSLQVLERNRDEFGASSIVERVGLHGSFGEGYDPFGECGFVRLDDSLGYNVLPDLDVPCKSLAFNDSSPLLTGTPIDGVMLRDGLLSVRHAASQLHL